MIRPAGYHGGMKSWISPLFAFGLFAIAALPAAAAERRTTVVELFTSQSCYSCPPAERFLGALAGEPNIVALEYHVDYWDDLVYGSAGQWKDKFSRSDHTDRQRSYNVAIRHRTGVYTPQIVIDGKYQAVGSQTGAVRDAIRKAKTDAGRVLSVRVENTTAGLAVHVDGDGEGSARVNVVTFIRSATTEVRAGENKGKTLVNHHVVTASRRIGTWQGKPLIVDLRKNLPGQNEGCAVLVQQGDGGQILGAAYCPMPGS